MKILWKEENYHTTILKNTVPFLVWVSDEGMRWPPYSLLSINNFLDRLPWPWSTCYVLCQKQETLTLSKENKMNSKRHILDTNVWSSADSICHTKD